LSAMQCNADADADAITDAMRYHAMSPDNLEAHPE
jgi:hypothetical protein